MKCDEAMRILGDGIPALVKYVDSVKALRRLTADRESPEFYQANQAVKTAKEACDWHAWNLRKHKKKHGC